MSSPERPGGRLSSSAWPIALMLLATAGAWVPLYLQRRAAHQPNFDDYLYALEAQGFAHADSVTGLVRAALHTGQTSPLVPLLAAPGAVRGVDGAVAVELPLLLLLAGGAWLLARRWVSGPHAALIGFAAAANQAVLGWAMMLHFSVATSALCLWSLAAYLWSDGFQRLGWSLLTGLSVGLLLLSRSLAPMYVAALVCVVAVDVARRRSFPWLHAGSGLLIALALAGPWWLVSGRTALDYLTSAGYSSSSGFARSGVRLTPSSILDRLQWTLRDLGAVQTIILIAALAAAIAGRRRAPGALLVAGWLVLTLLGLATSSNMGTGFGLPLVAVSVSLAGALIAARRRSPTPSPTEPASRAAVTVQEEGFREPEALVLAGPDTSIHLDGSGDAITFPDPTRLSQAEAISFEAWVRPDDVPTASGSAWQLISLWKTALLYLRGGAEPSFVFALYDTATSSYAAAVVGTTAVAAGTVYHVVGTFDAVTMRLYVDGTLEASLARHGPLNESSLGVAVAARGWGALPSPQFRGRLGEVAVYETALTPDQVRAHFTTGTAEQEAARTSSDRAARPVEYRNGSAYRALVVADSPAAYWHLADTAGAPADTSGNDGTDAERGRRGLAGPVKPFRITAGRAAIAGRLILAVLILAFLVLATSSNVGSGLGLPLVALTIVLAGALMSVRRIAAVVVITALGVGLAAEWSGERSPWWLGPPYRQIALQATNGAHVPNIDAVNRAVVRVIAGHPTLLVRDDDLLNSNSLVWAAKSAHLPLPLTTAPYGDAKAGARELNGAQFLLAGTSPGNFHDLSENRLDHRYTRFVETTAARKGWVRTRVWRLACANTIDLWQKGAPPSSPRATTSRRPASRDPYHAVVLADSPAAFWPLNDKACGPADASGHGNTGLYAGAPVLGAPRLVAGRDTSVHFDGSDDEINLPNSTDLSPTRAISFELWLRPDVVPTAPGSVWQLISKWNTALLYLRGGAKPKFVFALFDTATSSYASTVVGKTTVEPDTVYHVVGTYDGATMRIYVNGALEASRVRHGRLNRSSLGGVIGFAGWGRLPSPRFRGRLGEIAVYGSALTPAQVLAHYRVGKTA
jgi:Concanavalin A-like lectin/glucanases superfamily